MKLAKDILLLTKEFPQEEKFGLTFQMRRAAVSIPSNIGEGAGRGTDKEFKRFLDIALGSGYELETQILLSYSFGYIPHKDIDILLGNTTTVHRMLNGLKNKIKL